MRKPKTDNYNMRIDPELLEQVKRKAASEDVTVSSLVRAFFRAYLNYK